MKRRVKKVYKKLPPHTYEAHPVANAGEASKPLIIGIITIVAVILLSFFLLFSKQQFAGKAFFTGEMNSAGAELTGSAYENQSFSLKVRVNTDKEVGTVGFELELPPDLTCANVQKIQSLLGWEFKSDEKCDMNTNKIIFGYGTLGGKTGTFDVAQIDIGPAFQKDTSFTFHFSSFQALAGDTNVIVKIEDPTVKITAAPSCGDGVLNGAEQCDDGAKNEMVCTASYGMSCNYCSKDCTKATVKGPSCGDGQVTDAELCDGSVGEETCASYSQGLFTGGTLKCTNCKYDVAMCTEPEQVQQVFQCTGTTPANSQLCTGSDAGLSTDTARTLVAQCTMEDKCEYTCMNGYTLQNGLCVQQQMQPVCTANQWVCEGSAVKKQCKADGSGYNAPVICDPQQICSDGVCVGEQVLVSCGNTVIDPEEECDDGNPMGGDGCSSACMVESGYICAGMPSVCQKQVCTGTAPANSGLCTGDADGLDTNTARTLVDRCSM